MKLKGITNFTYIAVLAVLCASCNKFETDLECLSDDIENLVEENPDSALCLLTDMDNRLSSSNDIHTKKLIQLYLYETKNKLDMELPSDTILSDLTKYFRYQRMIRMQVLATYLLGCCYVQNGKSPEAVKAFNDAIVLADTTSRDCDYNTLTKIYGQLALVYRNQFLSKEEIKAWEQYSKFSFLSGDIYNSIRGQEFKTHPLCVLGDTIGALALSEKCHSYYLEAGYTEESVRVYPFQIYLMLMTGRVREVEPLMKEFENNSGLFDNDGNIEVDRQDYYYIKGLYFMNINDVDSAEYYFRKLSLDEHRYYRYKGLLEVYRQHANVDSVVRYSGLYSDEMIKILNQTSTSAVQQATALFNYNEARRIAESRAHELRLTIIYALIATFVLSIAFFLYYVRSRKLSYRRQRKIDVLNKMYIETSEKLERMDSEKIFEIRSLQEEIDTLKNEIKKHSKGNSLGLLMKSEVVTGFIDIVIDRYQNHLLTDSEWSQVRLLMRSYLPSFYGEVIKSPLLSEQEKQICILAVLCVKSGDMALTMRLSSQRITNLKSSANQKLFGEKNAKTLTANLTKLARM